MLAVTPLLVVLAYRYSHVAHPTLRDVQQKLADVATVAEENIVGVHVVKAFAQEGSESAKFRRRSEAVRLLMSLSSSVSLSDFSSEAFSVNDPSFVGGPAGLPGRHGFGNRPVRDFLADRRVLAQRQEKRPYLRCASGASHVYAAARQPRRSQPSDG